MDVKKNLQRIPLSKVVHHWLSAAEVPEVSHPAVHALWYSEIESGSLRARGWLFHRLLRFVRTVLKAPARRRGHS